MQGIGWRATVCERKNAREKQKIIFFIKPDDYFCQCPIEHNIRHCPSHSLAEDLIQFIYTIDTIML